MAAANRNKNRLPKIAAVATWQQYHIQSKYLTVYVNVLIRIIQLRAWLTNH